MARFNSFIGFNGHRKHGGQRLSGVNYKVALATIKTPDDNYIDLSAAAGGAPVISSPADWVWECLACSIR